MSRGRPKKNKEIPLSEESHKKVEQGLKEASEGKIEKVSYRNFWQKNAKLIKKKKISLIQN